MREVDIHIIFLGIYVYNCDASDLIINQLQNIISTAFFNIDPPYVKNGQRLYANYFKTEDHRNLEKVITEHLKETRWIVTYDDCNLIRDIYKKYHMVEYNIQHNVSDSAQGKELVITNIPKDAFVW